jgi:hypothetical protein
VKVSKQLKFVYRHHCPLGQVAADTPFNDVGFTFQPVDFGSEFLKGLALIGNVALHGPLKGQCAFPYFFRVFKQPFKRRCQKH